MILRINRDLAWGMVMQAYDSSSLETEDHEFKAILDYKSKPCYQRKNNKNLNIIYSNQ